MTQDNPQYGIHDVKDMVEAIQATMRDSHILEDDIKDVKTLHDIEITGNGVVIYLHDGSSYIAMIRKIP